MKKDIDELKRLWMEFSEVPIDNDDAILRDFHDFPKGTDRMEIWEWFDGMCPHGVVSDLVGTECRNTEN